LRILCVMQDTITFQINHKPAGPTTNTAQLSPRYEGKTRGCHCSHQAPDDGREKTPETCWAVNKRQDNKLKNCCIRLVVYLNCTMMHGLTNLKFKNIITYSCVYYRVLRCNVQWNMYAVVCCLVLLRVVPCNILSSLSSNVLLFMILCVYCKFWESVILMDHVYNASVLCVHFTVSSLLNAYNFP
jgi:hypothetical protein